MSPAKMLASGFLLALVFELLTIWLRFGCGLISAQFGGVIGRFTGGLRIHHVYVGVVLAVLALGPLRRARWLSKSLLVLSLAVIVSDLVHHLLVLWPLTGSPQFDLVYPPTSLSPAPDLDASCFPVASAAPR